MNTPHEDTVVARFFAPAKAALAAAKSKRECKSYPDHDFIFGGIGRVIAVVQSGRDWVQRLQAQMNSGVTVATFFQALGSTRRHRLTQEVATHVRDQVDQDCDASNDPLAEHPELEGFEVYASDGHYQAAATHTKPVEGKIHAQGSFFSLNLRSHSLSLLDIGRPKNKIEHDMSALKRLTPAELRLGAKAKTKVIHVYDPAGIDYHQWFKWKTKGIYFISREKANSRPLVIGEIPIEDDPRNTGVLTDERIGVFAGVMIRRIRYQDPASGEIFSFITNEFTLPPGLIAFLYKLRWDVEKSFDEKKNKLQENKAWATSDEAKSQQAHFVCMAHNLLVLLERKLEREEGLRDDKLYEKRLKRMEQIEKKIRAADRTPNPMVLKCNRITQRSLQFIRWLRNAIASLTSWSDGVAQLRPLMAKYLS